MFLRGKKGKYTDVEGYNRISRLIEDRQRDLGEESGEDEDFEEGAVLLSREPATRDQDRAPARGRDEPQASATVRPIPPASEERRAPAQPQTQPQTAQPGASAEERRIPFQPAAAETQPMPGVTAAAPKMTIPDLGTAGAQGSLVAAEAVWEGKLITNGNLRVEGTVHGEVQTTGTLFVVASAHIDGTIQARSILLGGEIEGQIHCNERLEILPGGSARGEIQTGSLVVHEGAFIDSRFQMRQPEPAARR